MKVNTRFLKLILGGYVIFLTLAPGFSIDLKEGEEKTAKNALRHASSWRARENQPPKILRVTEKKPRSTVSQIFSLPASQAKLEIKPKVILCPLVKLSAKRLQKLADEESSQGVTIKGMVAQIREIDQLRKHLSSYPSAVAILFDEDSNAKPNELAMIYVLYAKQDGDKKRTKVQESKLTVLYKLENKK